MTSPLGPAPEGSPSSGGWHVAGAGRLARKTVSAVLLVLACVLIPVSVLTVWVHDIVLDTDRYVETVEPLASDPAIEAAVRGHIVRAVEVRVDAKRVTAELATWLESRGLPPTAAGAVEGLAPQLNAAVTGAADRAAKRFVGSDSFGKVWASANRVAHSTVVHALTGRGRGAVGVHEDTVTLDVGAAVDRVRKELVDSGVSPAADIPDVDKQMVLFTSGKLERMRGAAHALDVVGTWMPATTVFVATAGVLLAHRRRRALARAALGAVTACLIVAVGLAVARRYYLDHLPPRVLSEAAAAAVFDHLLRFVRATLRTVIVLGVVVAVGACAVGPGRGARALRAASERTADSAARWADTHDMHAGRVGTWTADHRHRLTVGVLPAVALLFALWNHPTVLTVLLLVLVLLAVPALIALVAATGPRTQASGSAPSADSGPAGRRPAL